MSKRREITLSLHTFPHSHKATILWDKRHLFRDPHTEHRPSFIGRHVQPHLAQSRIASSELISDSDTDEPCAVGVDRGIRTGVEGFDLQQAFSQGEAPYSGKPILEAIVDAQLA